MLDEKSANEIKKESREVFSRFARTYNRITSFERGVHTRVVNKLSLFPYRSVLDVGSGTGALLSIIASKREDVKLAGIDIAPGMVEVAKENLGQKAEIVVGDAENLPWEDNKFDAVVSSYAFHHFPRPKIALSEIKRVLGPEGVAIIADVWLPVPFRQLLNLLIRFTKTGDVRVYSRSEVTFLLSDSGFKSLTWELANIFTFIATARK